PGRCATDRHPGNAQRDQTTANKDQRCQIDAIGEVLQPAAHGDIGHRPGDYVGYKDEFTEVVGEQQHDAPHAAAHDLAYTDFLGAAFCIEGGQPEQAEAGDRNCDDGEVAQ